MIIENTEFGRVEVTDIPLPKGLGSEVSGTYTASGRVLVSVKMPDKGKDWYRVFTMEDDGSKSCEVFEGELPLQRGANGIRWMCYPDNKRVLLGDYVLESEPSLDDCVSSAVLPVVYPKELSEIPGLFMRWSEILISPDNGHICFTTLTGSGAHNFLGKLVRKEDAYVVEDAFLISSVNPLKKDEKRPGYLCAQTTRGGEVKQFVRGGRGLSVAGGGKSVSESMLQMLDSKEVAQITNTLGYDETTIFSPDEKYGIVMSTRFSPGTDCGILGVIPLENDIMTRGKYLNVLYQFAIAGVRSHRAGNIGPALIDIKRSMTEGRGYLGVNLSDPEGRWAYYSPMSWHPDSTRAMWVEKTRLCAGKVECRLRRCRLMDVLAGEPVAVCPTPAREEIPYAMPVESAKEVCDPFAILAGSGAEESTWDERRLDGGKPERAPKESDGMQNVLEYRIAGQHSGAVVNEKLGENTYRTRYEAYSDDGETFYDGQITVTSPANMFTPGVTVIESRLQVTGAHKGKSELRLVLRADERFQIRVDRTPGEDGKPASRGYAEYDGVCRRVEDMAE